MAASEAFISSLMGVSDGDSTSGSEAQATDGSGTDGNDSSGLEASTPRLELQGSTAPSIDTQNSPAAPADAPKDQVANLNAAIRETRGENKQLRSELAELRAKLDTLTAPPKTQADADAQLEPDFLADPKAYVDSAKKDLKALTEKLEANEKQQTEQQKAQAEARETWGKVLESEATFVASTPDYHEALAHVRTVRTQQLQMLHPDATPQQIAQHIQGEEFQGAAQLVAQGKNPSEFYYNYAKTFGYKPKAAATAPATNQQQRPDKDAVRSMGSGGGEGAPAADTGNDPFPELAAARNERFKPRQRR